MMRASDIHGIDQLSPPEKILLVEDLWDSIAADESAVSVPESHLHELDERRKRHQADPGKLLTLEELEKRVQARR